MEASSRGQGLTLPASPRLTLPRCVISQGSVILVVHWQAVGDWVQACWRLTEELGVSEGLEENDEHLTSLRWVLWWGVLGCRGGPRIVLVEHQGPPLSPPLPSVHCSQ